MPDHDSGGEAESENAGKPAAAEQAADDTQPGANADSVPVVTGAMQRLSAEPSGKLAVISPVLSVSALKQNICYTWNKHLRMLNIGYS